MPADSEGEGASAVDFVHALVVLQVLPAMELGGVERGTLEVAKHLGEQGVRALVASAGGPLVAHLPSQQGFEHIDLAALNSKSPIDILVRAPLAIRQIVRLHKVTVVHARSRISAWSAWLATRGLRGVKLATTHHGAYALDKARWKRWVARVMLWSDGIILPSAFMLDFVCRHQRVRVCGHSCSSSRDGAMSLQGRLSPLPTSHLALRILLSLPALAAAPIRCVRWASLSTRPLQVAAESSWPLAAIIPRGVDIVSFSADPPARAAARALAREWHLCCNATYVLHLGRLTVQKGALDFLQALHLLFSGDGDCSDTCALVVGSANAAGSSGSKHSHSQAVAQAAGEFAAGRAQIRPHVSAEMVPALMLCCSVVVVPSRTPGPLPLPHP